MKLFLSLCIIATLLIASPGFAQVPIGVTGNLLVGGVWNRGLNSSDEILVIQLEANGTIIVDEGDAVKYFFNTTPTNLVGVTNWMAHGYDDSGWSDGQNGVGYNSSQITEVPDTDDQGGIYTRFPLFNLPNAASITSMTIRADYDDACIVWLNEVEVFRANMGGDAQEEIPVPEWDFIPTSKESTNKPGPDASRWAEPVSNLFGPADDNPNGSIVEFTFDVVLSATAVEPGGKLTTSWGGIKANY